MPEERWRHRVALCANHKEDVPNFYEEREQATKTTFKRPSEEVLRNCHRYRYHFCRFLFPFAGPTALRGENLQCGATDSISYLLLLVLHRHVVFCLLSCFRLAAHILEFMLAQGQAMNTNSQRDVGEHIWGNANQSVDGRIL